MNKNYCTIEEMAAKWNVSPRHIQYLCKRGKIEGAVKKAGVWFMPEDTPIPVKNSKSTAIKFEFIGTKKKIFDSAIELFMQHGYGCVSVRDIADAAGITQSAMYNHFKSKQQILDIVYDYYSYYYLADRPSLEDIESIINNGSLLDIMKSVHYDFKKEYEQNLQYITRIIMQRSSIDDRARGIAKTLMIDEGVRFVEAIFSRAIEMGRIAPLDTHAMAVFVNSVRVFTLHNWLVDDTLENLGKIFRDEMNLYKYAAESLVDLKPMAQKDSEPP